MRSPAEPARPQPLTDPALLVRQLARHQWVRLLGTPRVTVLAGEAAARQLWQRWASVARPGATLWEAETGAAFTEQLQRAVAAAAATPAEAIAVRAPRAVIERWRTGRRDRLRAMVDEGLIVVEEGDLDEPVGRDAEQDAKDVGAAPGDDGDDAHARGGAEAAGRRPAAPRRGPSAPGPSAPRARTGTPAPTHSRRPRGRELPLAARSAAEAAMFEALEATPATSGRFELNGRLAVRFGGTAAEVDLLSRQDGIAIELDGFHHFDDLECFRRDRRKDLLLQTQGLVVVRLLAEDVLRDAREAVTAVCEVLAFRRTEATRRRP